MKHLRKVSCRRADCLGDLFDAVSKVLSDFWLVLKNEAL